MPRVNKTFPLLQASLENDDKCTLVSIVPFLINEFKPGIYPGRFVISPCLNPKVPSLLYVGTSVHFVPQFNGDEELPSTVIKTHCKEIAHSVINDYMHGQMYVNEDCCPGLFMLPTEVSLEQIITKHKGALMSAEKKQLMWFGKLVQQADNDWNRYKRHTVISDIQRFAARALGLDDKEWLTPEAHEINLKCPMCLSAVKPEASICATCRCILNEEKYASKKFAA